ncbi:MAG: hypothetical protein JSR27_03015 [Proteobacteria bacterium]|nr:hypothetical protein [Pseudomonadota bacterium]
MRAGILRAVVLAAAGTGSALAGSFAIYAQTTPSGCTSIADVPPQYSGIQYGAGIQGLFDNFLTNGGMAGCVDCHTSPASGASGHLDLTDGVSWAHLVNVSSHEDPAIKYVVPNHPEQSLLFQKVNCDVPATGVRMPYQFPPDTLSAEQQAMIYDWIAEGAPVDVTDGIFRGTFDIRGFAQ